MCMFEKRVSFVGVLFLVFEKSNEQKIGLEIFRFVSMLFLVFEKSNEQKIAPEIFRLVSMLFNVIINVIIF